MLPASGVSPVLEAGWDREGVAEGDASLDPPAGVVT